MDTDTPSRRQAMRMAGGVALATGAAVAASSAPAAAEQVSYKPGRYAATPILSTQARHLVGRFSYGVTPGLAADVRRDGGQLAWFDRQLETAYDGSADGLCDWWPDLRLDPVTLWERNVSGARSGVEVMCDYGRRSLMRRLQSPRQVLEVMAEFWENHFHVPTNADNVFTLRAPYGEVIRSHALGRFEDLLQAAVLDPAMLMYLGAATSTKAHPNENLGRELLELHTLGVGNYTEDDVKSSARILTGYHVDLYRTWAPSYQPGDHWTGPVAVAGFSDPNPDADGRSVATAYLSHLAHHPATARRIATKLIANFVSDEIPGSLVERLAATYLASDTAIAPVLRELVRSPEFRSSVDQKVRDADEDVLATYRLLGVAVAPPRRTMSGANQIYWQVAELGLEPFTWPRPDGQPVDNESWSSPTRVVASMALHWSMADDGWPTKDARFRKPADWVPRRSRLAFRDLVDHLSRLLLQRPSTETLLHACCTVAGAHPAHVLRAGDGWRLPPVVATILDSPAFYQH